MPDEGALQTAGLDRLSDSITELSQQVTVLRDILDEIREDVSWAVRNDRVLVATVPVLKRMAVDPNAEDWGEQLVIERGPGESDSGLLNGRIIRELLSTTEFNLNSIEDAARQMIERARELVDDDSPREPESTCDDRPLPDEQERSTVGDGRLF